MIEPEEVRSNKFLLKCSSNNFIPNSTYVPPRRGNLLGYCQTK